MMEGQFLLELFPERQQFQSRCFSLFAQCRHAVDVAIHVVPHCFRRHGTTDYFLLGVFLSCTTCKWRWFSFVFATLLFCLCVQQTKTHDQCYQSSACFAIVLQAVTDMESQETDLHVSTRHVVPSPCGPLFFQMERDAAGLCQVLLAVALRGPQPPRRQQQHCVCCWATPRTASL